MANHDRLLLLGIMVLFVVTRLNEWIGMLPGRDYEQLRGKTTQEQRMAVSLSPDCEIRLRLLAFCPPAESVPLLLVLVFLACMARPQAEKLARYPAECGL